jgi:thiamine pyrophosphokinase
MTKNVRRVWIFANGAIEDPNRLRALIEPGDRLLAADGGMRYISHLQLQPERVIGDLDSIDPDEAHQLAQRGVMMEKYPVDKDETDLELAINRALAEGFDELRIAGGLGGRLDQTLGNLFLLSRGDLIARDVRLEDGREEVFLIRKQAVIHGEIGDSVSLLPLGGVAKGITTRGLQYPLRGETLFPERTRGISNVLVEENAEVMLDEGCLICIHTRIKKNNG